MNEKKQILVAALARQVRRKWPLSRERGSIRSKPNWPKAIIPQPSRDRSSVEGGACRRRDEPEATAEKVRDGWLHIGNMTIKDRKGYVRITGRLTDMIIRGAFNPYFRFER